MIEMLLTALLNFFTYMSVTISTDSSIAFLAAFFLYSASIGLEALPLWKNVARENSKIIQCSALLLGSIFIIGVVIAITGFAHFMEYAVPLCGDSVRILISTPQKSILPLFPSDYADITWLINLCGLISTLIPLILASRIQCIKACRKKYNLQTGLYGK